MPDLLICSLTSSISLQLELRQLPRYVKLSATPSASPWIEHDLTLCGCKVHTKGRDDFDQLIQKHLRLLFEEQKNIVCIFQIDKFFCQRLFEHRGFGDLPARQLTDRKVGSSNPNSRSRQFPCRLGQPGSNTAPVPPSVGMTARDRKGTTAERFFDGFGHRLLKILRQPTTGFALLGAHQQLEHEAAWCSTFSCLETSQTGDLAGFQVRGSKPTSASRLPLSRLGQPGSTQALMLPLCGMRARHRKERLLFVSMRGLPRCPELDMRTIRANWQYPTLVLPSGSMVSMRRKGVTAERFRGTPIFRRHWARPTIRHLDCSCLGLGRLTLSHPSCFLRVSCQVDTEGMFRLNDCVFLD
ncbi:hypothetical protein CSKR_105796 [Clonorchis sinensis]|uniref:Uncharacterized protein n=1 Tax=Clonorchis sinensis TaxID=79923 RepID=A0A3R7JQL7_CLOSI|nr:hypothetical protein CSKR_105796 [Clonorchis sinensis]